MVYNRKVNKVEVHVASPANMEDVQDAILRKMDIWKSAACPDWARDVIARVEIMELPSHRLKRGLSDSKPGPENHIHSVDWEMDWLQKT